MQKKWIIITIIIFVILICVALVGTIMSNVEHPKYRIISSHDNIEIRQYNNMIIAAVDVQGNRKDAISDGFRLLADYIFGHNTVQQKIDMTASVNQEKSTKIAMTAPVQQQGSGDTWTVSFIMCNSSNLI